jgi:hypothetical protein
LRRLGDASPSGPTDTIESLYARRQEIVPKRKSEAVQHDLAAADAGRKQLYLGLDGFVGTAESVERYERNEALKASVSDTTLGSILASYLGGGDVEKMRSLGHLGSNAEGIAITSLRSKGVDMRGVTVGSESTKTTRVLP